MKRIALALTLAVALAGCAGPNVSVFQGGSSITASIQNPVGAKELALVQNAYGLALTGAVTYRRVCYSAPLAQLPGFCKDRRNIVLTMQAYDRQAYAAIVTARKFVKDNPTISAVSAIGAARAAVSDFQSVVSANQVN